MINLMMGRVRVDKRPERQSFVASKSTVIISVDEERGNLENPKQLPVGTSRTTLGKLVDKPHPHLMAIPVYKGHHGI